jgi:hypothetical protein
MKTFLLKICAYVSMILFFGFICLYAFVWISQPNSGTHWSHISFGQDIHIAVTGNWGGNLVFFNQTMPYTGSVMSFTGDNTLSEAGLTGGGIYFRHIKHTIEKDKDWWTLMISLWYPIIIFGILPSVFVAKKFCATKGARRNCPPKTGQPGSSQ